MISAEKMIMFGGQAISDNNLKYNVIMSYNITNNKMAIKDQVLMKADKFFFNN